MMSKYSIFGVDTSNTFWVMGNIKVCAWRQRLRQLWWRQRRSSDHIQELDFFFETVELKLTTEQAYKCKFQILNLFIRFGEKKY